MAAHDHVSHGDEVELGNSSGGKLTDHQKYHIKHKGHEQMHAEMFLILLFTLVGAHICLTIWKNRHFRSYQTVSLVALLLVPVTICIKHEWYRFVTVWFLFCLITALIMKKGMQKPVTVTTPRMVYKYFYGVHLCSGFLSVVGYLMIVFGLFGLNMLFLVDQKTWFDTGLHMLFYGFYYGVIGRDLADVITDKMAVHIGYYSSDGIPSKKLDSKTCALCGNILLVASGADAVLEKTLRVSCGHQFHEFCLRGWCIVGKKDVCPYCKERINMKDMYKNPWDKPHVLLDLTSHSHRKKVDPHDVGNREKTTHSGSLKLNNNRLTTLVNFPDFISQCSFQPQALTILDLSFNRLAHVEPALIQFQNLHVLYLHGNVITNFPHLELLNRFIYLRTLTLHGNPVERTTGFRFIIISWLRGLKSLDFSVVTDFDRFKGEVWGRKWNVTRTKLQKRAF